MLVALVATDWPNFLRLATSALRFLAPSWRFSMDFCRDMLSASLVERRLAYSSTYLVRVLFSVVRFLTTAQSSAMACSRLSNDMDISMVLLAVPVLYLPWWDICCRLRRSDLVSMKYAWNLFKVFSGSDLARQALQYSWNFLVSAKRL